MRTFYEDISGIRAVGKAVAFRGTALEPGCLCEDELLKAVNTCGGTRFLPPPPLMLSLRWGVWITYWEFELRF